MTYLLIYTLVLCLPAILGSALSRQFASQGQRRVGLMVLIWGILLACAAIYLWIQAATGLSLSDARPYGLPPALGGLLMAAPGLLAALVAVITGNGIRTNAAQMH